MKQGMLIRDLPPGMSTEIGRVVVGYATLEHLLSSLIYIILDLSHEEGRLAARQPRAPDRFTLIRDLLDINNLKPKADLQTLQTRIENCGRQRDQIAHGIWLLDEETSSRILLRLTKGVWQPVKGQRGKTKRLIRPEGIEFGEKDARALRAYIDETADRLNELGEEVEGALRSSRRKSGKPHRPTHPHPGHNPKG